MDQSAPADRLRNPATVARATAVAVRVLARHDVDIAAARRAGGYTNLTWLAGGLAVRVAAAPGPGDLLREARLAAQLPPAAGCPRVIASGVLDGREWLLADEAPGANLGAVWPRLSWDDRARALGELWARADAVHGADTGSVAAHVRPSSPFYAPTPPAALAQIRRLEERAVLTPAQSSMLRAILERFWSALPGAPAVLNHGDLCTENALWHTGRVSALLDFEFAVLAPVELDANELLGKAYAPDESVDPLPDPTGGGRQRLRDAALTAVLPALQRRGVRDRILGYAVLLGLWGTHKWLAERDVGKEDAGWQPQQALAALARGDGGYLAPVLALVD